MQEQTLSSWNVVAAIALVFVSAFLIWFKQSRTEDKKDNSEDDSRQDVGTNKSSKRSQKSSTSKQLKKAFNFTHDLLHTSLKGHAGNVLGVHFSINGKYFATAAADRTVRLWSVKDFGLGNKCVHVNVELDHAKCIQFSPDSRAFVVGLARGNNVRIFRLGKKDDRTTMCNPLENDFKDDFKQELLNIGVGATSSGGSFVMTAYKDTTIIVRDIKGEVLNTINTNLGTNNYACVSPCGRYVGACGWTPDVKVWEVRFTKTGTYKDVVRAFELKGHKSSVWSFAFNNDSTRMITVSKKGMWRFYDTDIEYEKGQEPCLLKEGLFNVGDISPADNFCFTSLSYDGNVAAIASLNSFCVLSTRTGDIDQQFKEVHSELITALAFDIGGKFVISAGDRHVRVFHNILGYKESIEVLRETLRKHPPSSATRERLETQIKLKQSELDKILLTTQEKSDS
ncbi:transducin beta-like protein 2 [Styela clava]